MRGATVLRHHEGVHDKEGKCSDCTKKTALTGRQLLECGEPVPPSGQSNTNRSVFCKDFTDNEADKFGEMLKAGREIRKPLSLSKVETLDRKRSRYKERNQKPTVTQRIPLKD